MMITVDLQAFAVRTPMSEMTISQQLSDRTCAKLTVFYFGRAVLSTTPQGDKA
jgi:hypothetical protein